jgi:hypothetical protein
MFFKEHILHVWNREEKTKQTFKKFEQDQESISLSLLLQEWGRKKKY